MKVFVLLCVVAVALGQPINDENQEVHSVEKRHAEDPALDCSQITDGNRQACGEQVADNGRVIQKRDTQEVAGQASQDGNIQEAYSNEGGIAKQGEGGQYIYASDFGGPMVQILQHVYKSNCCSCGCECDCSAENGNAPTIAP